MIYQRALTPVWQNLNIDFSSMCPILFHIKIENYDGDFAEFALGNPAQGAVTIFSVAKCGADSKDDFPLRGQLWGRVLSGTSNIVINVW